MSSLQYSIGELRALNPAHRRTSEFVPSLRGGGDEGDAAEQAPDEDVQIEDPRGWCPDYHTRYPQGEVDDTCGIIRPPSHEDRSKPANWQDMTLEVDEHFNGSEISAYEPLPAAITVADGKRSDLDLSKRENMYFRPCPYPVEGNYGTAGTPPPDPLQPAVRAAAGREDALDIYESYCMGKTAGVSVSSEVAWMDRVMDRAEKFKKLLETQIYRLRSSNEVRGDEFERGRHKARLSLSKVMVVQIYPEKSPAAAADDAEGNEKVQCEKAPISNKTQSH